MVLYVAGVHVAHLVVAVFLAALGAAEDGVEPYGGSGGHIDIGIGDVAFAQRSAVHVVERALVEVYPAGARLVADAQSGLGAATEDVCIGEVQLRSVYQHVALHLHLVVVHPARRSVAAAEDVSDVVSAVAAAYDVDKGFLDARIGLILVRIVGVVVVAVVTAEEAVHAALQILHVGVRLDALVRAVGHSFALAQSAYHAAEVVATIYIIAHAREAQFVVFVLTDEHFGVAANVGVTGAAKGIVDGAVAEEHLRIARYVTLEAAAVDVLHLGTGTVQVGHAVAHYHAALAAAEGLEGVAVLYVDTGIALDGGASAVAAAENVEGTAEDVVALLAEYNARHALRDGVVVIVVLYGVIVLVHLYLVKQFVALGGGL